MVQNDIGFKSKYMQGEHHVQDGLTMETNNDFKPYKEAPSNEESTVEDHQYQAHDGQYAWIVFIFASLSNMISGGMMTGEVKIINGIVVIQNPCTLVPYFIDYKYIVSYLE